MFHLSHFAQFSGYLRSLTTVEGSVRQKPGIYNSGGSNSFTSVRPHNREVFMTKKTFSNARKRLKKFKIKSLL
jgi:hypothetical protein